MKGNIEQRGSDTWRVRVRGSVDIETGKRRVQRVTVRGKRRDAQRKLHEMLAALDAGTFVEPTKLTVGEHCRARLGQWGDWREVGALLELPDVSLHALRHTHALMLIDANVDIVRISKRLGHASPEITLRVYAHPFKRDDRKPAAAINDALAGMGA